MVAGGMSVGAANFRQTPGYGQSPALAEPYSSWGTQPIMYDTKGVKLPAPTVQAAGHWGLGWICACNAVWICAQHGSARRPQCTHRRVYVSDA